MRVHIAVRKVSSCSSDDAEVSYFTICGCPWGRGWRWLEFRQLMSIACSASSSEPTSTTAATTVSSPTAAAATATEAGHLGEARINVLLRLLEHTNKITSLLLVYSFLSQRVHSNW